MVSVAVACLPAAVSLLLLEALFMQISGMSLALTWPCRLCLLRVFLCWGRWHCTCFLRPTCLFTAHMGRGSSPLSCGVFLPLPLSQDFPLLVAGCTPPLLPEPFQPSPACLFTVPGKIPLPPFCTQCTSPYLLHVFIVLIAYYSVSLFSLGGGWSVQGAMLIWPRVVCGSTLVLLSSPCLCLSKLSGCGRLAAWGPSWFLHLTWNGDSLHRLEVWRGQLCLFSVIMPAKCVSSVSPRFYYRRLAFCFLPLAAILESSILSISVSIRLGQSFSNNRKSERKWPFRSDS
jgi:hypothetical protein